MTRFVSALLLAALLAAPASAQDLGEIVANDTGDTAWILTASALVLLMTLPGLALFYGGLARTKNMASVLTQVLGVACLAELLNTSFYFINQLVSALLNIMLTEKIIYPGDTCFVLRGQIHTRPCH